MRKLLIIFCVLLLIGCKKESATPTVDNTEKNTALLVGKWKLVSSEINPSYDVDNDGDKETDRYSNMPSCYQSFTFNFVLPNKGDVTTSCSVPFKSINWYLSEYGSVVNWKYNTDAYTKEKISSINNTTLVTKIELESPSSLHTITNTYTKL